MLPNQFGSYVRIKQLLQVGLAGGVRGRQGEEGIWGVGVCSLRTLTSSCYHSNKCSLKGGVWIGRPGHSEPGVLIHEHLLYA